jgi:GT2 family glycosyltransferase
MTNASVVIPFFDRYDALLETLNGLKYQSVKPDCFEVIVVDDGSADNRLRYRENIQHLFHMRVISQGNNGPGSARNRGAHFAKNELLVFFDVDMIPHPDTIEEYLGAYEKSPRAVLIGRQLPWPAAFRDKFATVYNYVSVGDLGSNERQLEFYHLASGNFAVSKSVLESTGCFDESFRMTEDTELGYRFKMAGTDLIYLPRAIGYHNHSKSFADLCLNTRLSAEWTGILMQQHSAIRGTIPVYIPLEPMISQERLFLRARKLAKCMLSIRISRLLLITAVRILANLSILPRIQRKLYNLILDGYRFTGLRNGLITGCTETSSSSQNIC